MVPTNDDSKHGSAALSRIVFMKIAEVAMSPWHRHAVEVVLVADGLDDWQRSMLRNSPAYMQCCSTYLKITADYEEVKIRDFPFSRPAFRFEISVDSVETSMALAIDTKNQSDILQREPQCFPKSILTQPTTAIRGCRELSCISGKKVCW